MSSRGKCLVLIAVIWPLEIVRPAQAQRYASNEVTVGVEAQTWGYRYYDKAGNSDFKHYLQYPVPSVSYTRNLSSTLAVEGSVEPWTQFFHTNYLESGHATLALGGIKAGWRGERWGFYGKTQAGIASWSCGTWVYDPQPYSQCSRITNFALEYGGVVERQLSENYAIRLDAEHLISTEFDQVLARNSSGTAFYYRGGGELQHLDLRVGLTRSFGAVYEGERESAPAVESWDLGASFLMQPRTIVFNPVVDLYPSPSLWASWNFSTHVSWDNAVIHSGPFRNEGFVFSAPQAGGRSFEALTGVKAGLRRDRMGYFVRVRAGTVTFGETERRIHLLANGSTFLNRGQFTSQVLDAGGTWEVYLAQHMLLRFDAGSATTFYPPKTVEYFVPVHGVEAINRYTAPEQTQTGLLLSFGGGLRF